LRVYADGFLQPQSRHESDEFVAPVSIHQAAPVSLYDRSLSPFEPYDELNLIDGGGRSYEESMRVMYEDPGQLEEKKRLMSLFETQTQSGDDSRTGGRKGGKKAPTAVRRSTRMAGF
jgi:DNA replication regulator DPB11